MIAINKNVFRDIKKNKYFELLPDFKAEKTKKITTLILTLVALSFFGLFAISPTLSTIARLQKELEDNKFVDKQLQTKINNLSILQQKYSSIQNDLPLIYLSVPKSPEAPLLTAEIQGLASKFNLKITSLQIFEAEVEKKENDKKQYSSFMFGVSADGSYENISNFITSAIDMQRIINVEILSIGKKSGETTDLQMHLKGAAFFKK
ncbi:MAG TPA: type 4a pilus biogenesis protein PilO [Patescibacteria group bacterium]|nr:type 4a pilus biogenesis protein PilO [Patescibacteria group bacterium]